MHVLYDVIWNKNNLEWSCVDDSTFQISIWFITLIYVIWVHFSYMFSLACCIFASCYNRNFAVLAFDRSWNLHFNIFTNSTRILFNLIIFKVSGKMWSKINHLLMYTLFKPLMKWVCMYRSKKIQELLESTDWKINSKDLVGVKTGAVGYRSTVCIQHHKSQCAI